MPDWMVAGSAVRLYRVGEGVSSSFLLHLRVDNELTRPSFRAQVDDTGERIIFWTIPHELRFEAADELHLALHRDAYFLAKHNAEFEQQLRDVALRTMRRSLGVDVAAQPPPVHLATADCHVRQTAHAVVVLCRFGGGAGSPLVAADELTVSISDDATEARLQRADGSVVLVCCAESGRGFCGAHVRASDAGVAVHLEKSCGDDEARHLPWTRLYLGPSSAALTTHMFAETRALHAAAALQRRKDCSTSRRQRASSEQKERRPLTLVYRTQHAALVDVANRSPPPAVPLSVVVDNIGALVSDGSDAGSSLSSSPESVDASSEASTGDDLVRAAHQPCAAAGQLRVRSLSECCGVSPVKGILKRRPLCRSVSEYEEPRRDELLDDLGRSLSAASLGTQSSATSSFDDGDSGLSVSLGSSGSFGALKKMVRFNERIQQRNFRPNSSILGQRKKNQKKQKNRQRRNSTGSSDADDAPVGERLVEVTLRDDDSGEKAAVDTCPTIHEDQQAEESHKDDNEVFVADTADDGKRQAAAGKGGRKQRRKKAETPSQGQLMARTRLLDQSRLPRAFVPALGRDVGSSSTEDSGVGSDSTLFHIGYASNDAQVTCF